MFNNNLGQHYSHGGHLTPQQVTFVQSAVLLANILAIIGMILAAPWLHSLIEPYIHDVVVRNYGYDIAWLIEDIVGILVYVGTFAILRMSLVTAVTVVSIWIAQRLITSPAAFAF